MNRAVLMVGVLLTTLAAGTAPGRAQVHGAEQFFPSPAPMSEEVARQKLQTYGVTGIESLRPMGDSYLAKGRYRNQVVELELNRLTGELRQKGRQSLLEPANPALPMITDRQIKVDRRELVRPELMPPQ